MTINKVTNWFRRRFGLGYWSLSGWAKLSSRRPSTTSAISSRRSPRRRAAIAVDGVICGHIHHPASRDIGGVHYVNCGDWIESCTVVVETVKGGLEILWTPPQELAPVAPEGESGLMRILIATDAWRPQVNGVVQHAGGDAQAAKALGAEVVFLNPEGFRSIGLPSYPGIRLACPSRREIFSRIAAIRPDAIHIATEGTDRASRALVLPHRAAAVHHSFHTRFADYASARFPVPAGLDLGVAALVPQCRPRHHGLDALARSESCASRASTRCCAGRAGSTPACSIPIAPSILGLPRPVFLAVGRLAVEKNVEAFLSLDLPGSKVVVGDGPARET